MSLERITDSLHLLRNRLRHTVSLIDYIRRGYEFTFAADFSELYSYLHPDSAGTSHGAILDDSSGESAISTRHRLALALLLNNSSRPALLLYPHMLEFKDYLEYLARPSQLTWSSQLTEVAKRAWESLSEHHRALLQRLRRGDPLSQPDIIGLLALVKGEFESICTNVTDHIHLSCYGDVLTKLRQLLDQRRILFCGPGNQSDPFGKIEVPRQDALQFELFYALRNVSSSRMRRETPSLADVRDAEALAFVKGLNERLHHQRVVLVSSSRRIEKALSEWFPQLLDNFCSLEGFFLLMLSNEQENGRWHKMLDAELSAATAAIERVRAQSAHCRSTAVKRSLVEVRDSLALLVNQRLGDVISSHAWLFSDLPEATRGEYRTPTDVTDRQLTLLLGFVKFVSQDDEFRQRIREDSLKTWNQVASAVDGLRKMGRYQSPLSCFVSYSAKDAGFVQKLVKDLKEGGVQCWFAPDEVKVGQDFSQEIENAIHMHERFIVIVSKNAVEAKWVLREVEAGFEMERERGSNLVIPLRLDDELERTQISWAAHLRRTRQAADFRALGRRDNLQEFPEMSPVRSGGCIQIGDRPEWH